MKQLDFSGQRVPEIWEMGTGVMIPEYRGTGVNNLLRLYLYDHYISEMRKGNILVIGTTKTPELRSVLDRLSIEYGDNQEKGFKTDFKFCNREKFPHIAPFTCVCTPDFGTGYQYGDVCPAANTTIEGFQQGKSIAILPSETKANIPCTMFVSSTELAQQTDNMIANSYKERRNLANNLIKLNYY